MNYIIVTACPHQEGLQMSQNLVTSSGVEINLNFMLAKRTIIERILLVLLKIWWSLGTDHNIMVVKILQLPLLNFGPIMHHTVAPRFL